MISKRENKKAWVVAVDMGYGHQRTAYALRDIAFGGRVINANSYDGIPKKDKKFCKMNPRRKERCRKKLQPSRLKRILLRTI